MCGEIRLCTFVRFVRCVTLIGDYYALLRSRFALRLYGFCRMALQLLSILERDERQLYASSSLFVFCRLRKNSNYTAPRKSDTLISYFNSLSQEHDGQPALSAKTIKNIHGVLHKALQQAVLLNYIRYNPTTACVLPKIVKKEIRPLTDQQTAQLLNLLKGSKYEIPLTVDLFTGLREGELLGLMWNCVDFEKGTLLINKQLRRSQRKGGTYYFSPPKNNKGRTIAPAPYVMKLLQTQKAQQAEQRLLAGPMWEDSGLVFTNEFGRYVSYRAIFDRFKRIVKRIGLPDARIHDLRHTYAVNCIRAGDDIKTVQSNLGHATAAFTLDVYGHFTDDMRSVSAQRMEGFITNVLNL